MEDKIKCEECGYEEDEGELNIARKKIFDGDYFCDACWHGHGIEKMREYYLSKKYDDFFEFLNNFEDLYPDRWACFTHEDLVGDKLKYYQIILETYISCIVDENKRYEEAKIFFHERKNIFFDLFRINYEDDTEFKLLNSFFKSFVVFLETLIEHKDKPFEIIKYKEHFIKFEYSLKIEDFEKRIREFIENHLKHHYGDDWKKYLTSSVCEKIGKGQKNYNKKHLNAKDQSELTYCDIGDYESIILYDKNWDIFEQIFKDKDFLKRQFEDLRELRNNVVAHPKNYDESDIKRGEAALFYFEKLWRI